MARMSIRPRGTLGALTAALAAAVAPATAGGDLAKRYSNGQQQASALQSRIQAEDAKLEGFEGTATTLQARLMAIKRSVALQSALLATVSSQLSRAHAKLVALDTSYAYDRRLLAAELVAEYESPPPTVVDVVVDADGFDQLLNQLHSVKAIEQRNTAATRAVNSARLEVALQTARLAGIRVRRRRATAAVLVERDEIAGLRLAVVRRELQTARDRADDAAQLESLRKTLAHEALVLDLRAAGAQGAASSGVAATPGACRDAPFTAHGGPYGFFPAPGTNYTAGQEPIIAARLDALGRALQLHLIGISGYRTPQHSLEVGGYADDPHTRGEASDTPGVEGVPEATLESFCLTRPFPGPREADHVQEN